MNKETNFRNKLLSCWHTGDKESIWTLLADALRADDLDEIRLDEMQRWYMNRAMSELINGEAWRSRERAPNLYKIMEDKDLEKYIYIDEIQEGVMSALKELGDLDICSEARKWINEHPNKSLQELWDICERGDWMLFLLRKNYYVPKEIYREMAWEFAVGAIQYSGRNKDVCIETLDIVSQFLNGECSLEELIKSNAADAADAAYVSTDDAAYAANIAAHAAAHAAHAQARLVSSISAARAASAAVYAAAVSASSDSVDAADAVDAVDAVSNAQAQIIRHFVPKLSEVAQ